MIDIVFPKKNEKEFLAMAKELGFDKLVFVYQLKGFPKENFKGATKAVLCKPNEINQAKQKAKIVLVESSSSNRQVIEKSQADIIFNLENETRRDLTHSKRSGLNQVLCKLLAKKNKIIGFNFNSLLKANKGLRVGLMGRMMQNVKLCRKFKVKMLIASFAKNPYEMRAAHDLIAFGITLGMHPKEAKQSLRCIK